MNKQGLKKKIELLLDKLHVEQNLKISIILFLMIGG